MRGAAASVGAAAPDGMAGGAAEAEAVATLADVLAVIPAVEGRVAGDLVAATQAVGMAAATEVADMEVATEVVGMAAATEVTGSETRSPTIAARSPPVTPAGFY
jgi:hypothetical protein